MSMHAEVRKHHQIMSFAEIESALAAGRVQMLCPHGDWVTVRRRGANYGPAGGKLIPVYMEREVEGMISQSAIEKFGLHDVRVVDVHAH